MPSKKIIIPWDDIRVLMLTGLSVTAAAGKLGITPMQISRRVASENPDLTDLSHVPDEVFAKYGITRDGSKLPGTTIEGTDVTWDEVSKMLGIGLTTKEVAACCGVTPDGLSELYKQESPAIYDALETWATVLRARKTYELFVSIERRAIDGDLRSAITLARMRAQRHPKDCLAPPTQLREFS